MLVRVQRTARAGPAADDLFRRSAHAPSTVDAKTRRVVLRLLARADGRFWWVAVVGPPRPFRAFPSRARVRATQSPALVPVSRARARARAAQPSRFSDCEEPVAEGGNLIKWKWFSIYDRPPHREIKDKITLSWDTALSAKELSSYSVCVILQVRGETAFVLEVFRERLEYPDLKRKVTSPVAERDEQILFADREQGIGHAADSGPQAR
jgi:hypothetical protein